MTTRNIVLYFYVAFIVFTINSCIKVKDFTKQDLKWFTPYNKSNTVIFISKKGELDTIIFYQTTASSDTIRNFEQGYYNENHLSVQYKLTRGSYHQFALMGDGNKRYDQNIFNLSKSSSNDKSTLEITFLGTLFNGKELNNIKQINAEEYYFDSKKATYVGMDEEQGKAINNFTFDIKIGIVKYTDQRGIEWTRK